MYFSISLDRTKGGCVFACSEKGGVNIEDADPRYLKTFFIPLHEDISEENLIQIVNSFNLGQDFDV